MPRGAMRAAAAIAVATLALHLTGANAIVIRANATRHSLRKALIAPAFAAPRDNAAKLNLQGFCKKPDGKPACTTQPCCCWSAYAADIHPMYPSSAETHAKQECSNPPDGFRYAPEPGGSYDDGYMDTLKNSGLVVYDNRRLCCLRRANGVQDDSQRDMSQAVPTTSTTIVITTTTGIPEPGAVDPVFTTKIVTTSLMNPGDEYENAQMEMAARAHLAAADDLSSSVSALNASATAIQEVNDVLQTDPNLVRSRKHVAEMRSAIRGWAVRRWVNLKKLAGGEMHATPADAEAAAAPAGLTRKELAVKTLTER